MKIGQSTQIMKLSDKAKRQLESRNLILREIRYLTFSQKEQGFSEYRHKLILKLQKVIGL